MSSPSFLDRQLLSAAQKGTADSLSDALSRGALPTRVYFQCYSPLHYAAENGHVECCALLLQALACLDLPFDPLLFFHTPKGPRAFPQNPLHLAASSGALDCCRLLIKAIAPHLPTTDGHLYTPLHYAAEFGHPRCLELLLPQSNAQSVDRAGNTALHLAAEYGQASCVAMLLPHLSANTLNDSLSTPLHLAANFGALSCVNLLLAHTDCELRNQKHETALELAQRENHWECVLSIEAFQRAQEQEHILERAVGPTFTPSAPRSL